jgi:Domain of unknown function (DUF1707)/Cell wall-active antibiotics response 4TMS YvqF
VDTPGVTDHTPAVRASDAEREQTAALLRGHVVEGRLTLEEFSERLDAAYAARTRDELDALTHDLPVAAPESVPQSRRRPKRLTGVAFGSVERRGRWRVPRFATLAVVFGDADIDLRAAEIHGQVVTINVVILFGNADFYVPRSVDVDLGGLTIFGHRREHGDEGTPAPDAPLVRIRVYSLFGTSDVWRIPPGMSGTYRELIRAIRKRKQLPAG